MVQPAGYIRIITEKLTEKQLTISVQVVSAVEHVAVGLPLLHLAQSPLKQPKEGVEPQQTARQLGNEQFGRMAVTDVARLVSEHRLTLLRIVS